MNSYSKFKDKNYVNCKFIESKNNEKAKLKKRWKNVCHVLKRDSLSFIISYKS